MRGHALGHTPRCVTCVGMSWAMCRDVSHAWACAKQRAEMCHTRGHVLGGNLCSALRGSTLRDIR